jgi:disulfide bond formation protein DsbB
MTLYKEDMLFAGIIAATITILSALYIEHVLEIEPCMLCLWQRKPYYIALGFGVLWLGLQRYHHLFTLVFIVIFLVSCGLGFYHAGAEFGYWAGPTSCGGGKTVAVNASDLLKSMNDTKVVDCSKVAYRIFGQSLAAWNAIVSLILAAGFTGSMFFLRVRK